LPSVKVFVQTDLFVLFVDSSGNTIPFSLTLIGLSKHSSPASPSLQVVKSVQLSAILVLAASTKPYGWVERVKFVEGEELESESQALNVPERPAAIAAVLPFSLAPLIPPKSALNL